MDPLVLKRAALSRSSGRWNDDDFDVLVGGKVVGRIYKASAAPVGSPWMWTLAFGQHEDRTPTHGYGATREAAMAAFAKSWRRGEAAPGHWRGASGLQRVLRALKAGGVGEHASRLSQGNIGHLLDTVILAIEK